LLAAAGDRNAVYLCEQAAEKIIRAVLTSEGKHAGIKHQLNKMVDLLPEENPLKATLRAVEHLAACATAYRYPTAAGRIKQTPRSTSLDSDIEKVETALSQTTSRLGVNLASPDAPATRPGPIR
jgi:HEPN domain-containing protein